MAIDYTASNGSPADPRSLHYVDPAGVVLNDYAKAMSGIGRVLEFYGEHPSVAADAGAVLADRVVETATNGGNTHRQESHSWFYRRLLAFVAGRTGVEKKRGERKSEKMDGRAS